MTIFPVTQPRSVLHCLTDREQEIPKTSFEQASARIDEILERMDKFFSNTESVPTCPLSIAYDNRQAKLRIELVKQEERATKRLRTDEPRQITPQDPNKAARDPKSNDRSLRDTSGCVVYKGTSAFMPFVAETDVSRRRCIPHIREGCFCKKKKCDNNHEKDPLKWEPSITKAWDNLIQATNDLEWGPKVDQDKLKAHIAKA